MNQRTFGVGVHPCPAIFQGRVWLACQHGDKDPAPRRLVLYSLTPDLMDEQTEWERALPAGTKAWAMLYAHHVKLRLAYRAGDGGPYVLRNVMQGTDRIVTERAHGARALVMGPGGVWWIDPAKKPGTSLRQVCQQAFKGGPITRGRWVDSSTGLAYAYRSDDGECNVITEAENDRAETWGRTPSYADGLIACEQNGNGIEVRTADGRKSLRLWPGENALNPQMVEADGLHALAVWIPGKHVACATFTRGDLEWR